MEAPVQAAEAAEHKSANEGRLHATKPQVRARSVAFLTLATLGFYTAVFFYAQARELGRLGGKQSNPWKWFVAPLFLIPLPIAAGIIGRNFAQLSDSSPGLPLRAFLYGTLGFFAIAGALANAYLGSEFSITVAFAAVGILSLMLGLIARDINKAKASVSAAPIDFSRSQTRTWFTVFGNIAFGMVALILIPTELQQSLSTPVLPPSRWHHDSGQFSVQVGDGWHPVEIGTYSNGTGIAEFEYMSTGSAIVFDQSQRSFHNVLEARRLEAHAENRTCSQRVWLRVNSMIRVGELVCSGTYMGLHDAWVVTAIDDGNGLMEIISSLQATDSEEESVTEAMRKFARSFRFETETTQQDE